MTQPAAAPAAAARTEPPPKPPAGPPAKPQVVPKSAPKPKRPAGPAADQPEPSAAAAEAPARPGLSPLSFAISACDTLLHLLRTEPRRLLLWTVAIYGALWVAAAISFGGLPAIGYDMLLFGHERQWGYSAFPPLAPWLADLAFELTGQWASAQLLLSVGSVLLTLFLVWRLGAASVGRSGAALAVVLTITIQYFGAEVTSYDPATAALPIFAAAVLLYRRAVLGNARLSWLLLGIALAALITASHAAGLLVVVLAGHLLLTAEGRRRIIGTGPAIAAGAALLLLLPHLLWLIGAQRLAPSLDLSGSAITTSLGFLFGHAALHIGMILIAVLAVLPLPPQTEPAVLELQSPTRFDRSLVLSAAIGPWLLTALAPLAGIGITPHAGGALVALSGLALVSLLPQSFVLRSPRLAVAVWLLLLVGLPIGHAVSVYAKASGSGPLPTELYPARALSNAMQAVWKSRTTRGLDIVTGSARQAGFVAAYASPRPSVFIDADFHNSPWITPERLKRSGTLVVWATDEFPRTDELPAPYRGALGNAAPIFGTMVLPLGRGKLKAYGWAMILPEGTAPIPPPQPTVPPAAPAQSPPQPAPLLQAPAPEPGNAGPNPSAPDLAPPEAAPTPAPQPEPMPPPPAALE